MQKLIFTLRYLLKGRGNNAIKLISLSLGLTVGILLLAHISFEKSFDKYSPDADRTYRIDLTAVLGDDQKPQSFHQLYGPMPSALAAEIPEIECGTSTLEFGAPSYFQNENDYEIKTVIADTSFFETLGIPVLQGRLTDLTNGNIALSDKMAKTIFNDKNPIGQSLMYNRTKPYTVTAVYKTFPENSHLQYDIVIPMIPENMYQDWGIGYGWEEGDAYIGYVKLRKGADRMIAEQKIPDVLRKNYDYDAERAQGFIVDYYFNPIGKIHIYDEKLDSTIFILSVLALMILFVAAMNYVLISVSSLATRARTMAVHKCNGASTWDIFSMFLRETGVLILLACIVAVILITGFQKLISEYTIVRFPTMNFQNLWPAGLAVLATFLISGLVPAYMFSSVPVTQAFHKYSSGNKYWKRSLLFVQFAISALMIAMLTTTIRQYDLFVNKDMGYDYKNVVFANIPPQSLSTVKNALQNMPAVENIGYGGVPARTSNGCVILEENDQKNGFDVLFHATVMNRADPGYVPTLNIKMKYGNGFSENSPKNAVIINELLAQKMGWTGDPTGKPIFIGGGYQQEGLPLFTVTGVMENLHTGNLYNEQTPVVMFPLLNPRATTMFARLKEVNPDNIEAVNRQLAEIFGNNDISVNVYSQTLMDQYKDAVRFRNSIMVAAFVTLIITLMGLLGYITDEIRRRSKEIAIRKINGADASNVIRLVARDTSVVSLPAILIGLGGAYYTSTVWLQQFAVKIPLTVWVFLFCGIGLLLLTASAITFKTWRTANENPVKSIKTE